LYITGLIFLFSCIKIPALKLAYASAGISVNGSKTGWYVSTYNEKFNLISAPSALAFPNEYVSVFYSVKLSGNPILAGTIVPL
jgi:hypothetical protein